MPCGDLGNLGLGVWLQSRELVGDDAYGPTWRSLRPRLCDDPRPGQNGQSGSNCGVWRRAAKQCAAGSNASGRFPRCGAMMTQRPEVRSCRSSLILRPRQPFAHVPKPLQNGFIAAPSGLSTATTTLDGKSFRCSTIGTPLLSRRKCRAQHSPPRRPVLAAASLAATCCLTTIKLSALIEIESMLQSTRKSANSG